MQPDYSPYSINQKVQFPLNQDNLLFGNEQIETDHSLLFSFSTINKLLSRYDLEIINWFVACETQKSRKSKLTTPLFNLFYKIFPQLSDKIILMCKIK